MGQPTNTVCVCALPLSHQSPPPQEDGSSELKVYDLTDYVEEHPGGLSILNNAGARLVWQFSSVFVVGSATLRCHAAALGCA